MLNTLGNTNNITSTLYQTNYSVLHKLLILKHTQLQHAILTTREGVLILHISVQWGVWIGIGSSDNV